MPLNAAVLSDTRRVQQNHIPQFEDSLNSGDASIKSPPENIDIDVYVSGKLASLQSKKMQADTVIDRRWFNFVVNSMTLINTIQMGIEADHPDWTGIWTLTENMFTATFAMEMFTKLYILQCRYFHDKANLLDGFLTVMGILDCWILSFLPGGGADLQSLSILRVLRLVRLARIFKLMRNFKPMVLMLEGIVKTISVTVYVFGLLVLCFYVFAIFFTQYMGKDGKPDLYPGYSVDTEFVDSQAFMMNYNPSVCWGSVSASMLTLFNLALLTEWSEVVRPIAWKQPVFVIVLIIFVIFVAFGVMNVMIGLIVDSVITESKRIDHDYDQQKLKEKIKLLSAIQGVLLDMDTNHDEEVSLEELQYAMANHPHFGELLKLIDLPEAWEPRELLLLLDTNGDGLMAKSEFTTGFFRLIESNDFQQLCLLQAGLNEIKTNVFEVSRTIHSKLSTLEEDLHSVKIATGSAKINQDDGQSLEGNSHDSNQDLRKAVDAAFDAAYVTMKESFHRELAAEKPILKTWLMESCTITGETLGTKSHVSVPPGCHETCTSEDIGSAIVEAPVMIATGVTGHSSFSTPNTTEEAGSSKLFADTSILDGVVHYSCTKSTVEAQHIDAASQTSDVGCAAVLRNLDVAMPQLEIATHQLEDALGQQCPSGSLTSMTASVQPYSELVDAHSETSENACLCAAPPCNHAGNSVPSACVDLLSSNIDQSTKTHINQRDPIIYFRFEDGTQKLGFEINWVPDALPFVGSVLPDGAANLCGVLPGDRIAECNGLSLIGKDRPEVLHFLRARPLVLQMLRTDECHGY